jgi:predicted lipoprotein with Yx(FWY)xxD motif
MKPAKVLLATTGAAIVTAALGASALAAPLSTHAPVIKLEHTRVGRIIVARGDTLFAFTRDRRNKDMCVKIKGCAGIWHPLLSSGKPRAASGVKASLLGKIKLSGGRHQVTYNRHPLYIYSVAPKGTSYVGFHQFGGTWEAVKAGGKTVR